MSLITNIGSGISNDRDCVLSILESLMENSVQQMVKFAVFIKVSPIIILIHVHVHQDVLHVHCKYLTI